MRMVLEITSDTGHGEKIWLRPGQAVVVGRTEYADIVLPFDRRLSATHFSVSCDQATCRLRDLESASGTTVNGERVTDGVLRHGDRIVAGDTQFSVRLEGMPGCDAACGCADSAVKPAARSAEPAVAALPVPAVAPVLDARLGGGSPRELEPLEFRLGNWRIDRLPAGWTAVASRGLRGVARGPLATTIAAHENSLPAGASLPGHVGMLADAVCRAMDVELAGPSSIRVGNSIDGLSLVLHHAPAAQMRLVQRQVFVTGGSRLGILTLLADESEFDEADGVFHSLLPHIAFGPAAIPANGE